MQISPAVRRYKESAFVMITCEDEQDIFVLDALRSISEIKEIQHTYGNYDIIIKIETDTVKSLKDVIDLKIKKIGKIRATTTLISSPMIDI
jgi:anthranilate phosphoribosyltransferase